MSLHLRTLLLALCVCASLGGLAGRGGSAPFEGRATGATIGGADSTVDPFLAAGAPLLEVTPESRSGGSLQLHRGPAPRPVSSVATHAVTAIPATPVQVQSWVERGRRAYHLGTPPPSNVD